ncbi:MAG: hypothetical protein F6K09_13630, partial [Merismopedia sp. SIO2A8]|nr:hypothetical protein [Merismopedia sp. SIO2A8]
MELSAEQFLEALATQDEDATPDDAKAAWEALETHFAGLRRESLDAAAMGRLSAAAMNPVLRY